MGKIFAVGDIHGCNDRLCAMMDNIDIDFKNDLLLFIGDYIDRGPDSFDVVEYLINLKIRYPNIIFLKGNHEDMFEKFLSEVDTFTYLINGGQETLKSYAKHNVSGDPVIPSSHLDFYKSLLPYYETNDYIFVHAGLREKIPLCEQGTDDLLWIRRSFIHSEYDFGKRVIFGHTPFPDPYVQPNKIGIDTGAVFGNKLTCVKLPDVQFFFV